MTNNFSLITTTPFSNWKDQIKTAQLSKILIVIVVKNPIKIIRKLSIGKYTKLTLNFNLSFYFSQFCTLAFCAKCRYKTRVYPLSEDLSRGDCCKICDRKFFIREMMKDK